MKPIRSKPTLGLVSLIQLFLLLCWRCGASPMGDTRHDFESDPKDFTGIGQDYNGYIPNVESRFLDFLMTRATTEPDAQIEVMTSSGGFDMDFSDSKGRELQRLVGQALKAAARNRKIEECRDGVIKVFTYRIEIEVQVTSLDCTDEEEKDIGRVLDLHFDDAFGALYAGGAGAITKMKSFVCHKPTNTTEEIYDSVAVTDPPVVNSVPAPVVPDLVNVPNPPAPAPSSDTSVNSLPIATLKPSQCAKWYLHYMNNFEDGHFEGWNNERYTFSVGFSNFLGNYCKSRSPWRIFNVPMDATQVDLRFKFYEIGKWEGHEDKLKVKINNKLIDLGFFDRRWDEGKRQGTVGKHFWWESESIGTRKIYGDKEKHNVVVHIPRYIFKRFGTLRVEWRFILDNCADESGGLDDVAIHVLRCDDTPSIPEYTPSPTPGLPNAPKPNPPNATKLNPPNAPKPNPPNATKPNPPNAPKPKMAPDVSKPNPPNAPKPNPPNAPKPNPPNATKPNPPNAPKPNPPNATKPNPPNAPKPNPPNAPKPNPPNATKPNPSNAPKPNPPNATKPNPPNAPKPNPPTKPKPEMTPDVSNSNLPKAPKPETPLKVPNPQPTLQAPAKEPTRQFLFPPSWTSTTRKKRWTSPWKKKKKKATRRRRYPRRPTKKADRNKKRNSLIDLFSKKKKRISFATPTLASGSGNSSKVKKPSKTQKPTKWTKKSKWVRRKKKKKAPAPATKKKTNPAPVTKNPPSPKTKKAHKKPPVPPTNKAIEALEAPTPTDQSKPGTPKPFQRFKLSKLRMRSRRKKKGKKTKTPVPEKTKRLNKSRSKFIRRSKKKKKKNEKKDRSSPKQGKRGVSRPKKGQGNGRSKRKRTKKSKSESKNKKKKGSYKKNNGNKKKKGSYKKNNSNKKKKGSYKKNNGNKKKKDGENRDSEKKDRGRKKKSRKKKLKKKKKSKKKRRLTSEGRASHGVLETAGYSDESFGQERRDTIEESTAPKFSSRTDGVVEEDEIRRRRLQWANFKYRGYGRCRFCFFDNGDYRRRLPGKSMKQIHEDDPTYFVDKNASTFEDMQLGMEMTEADYLQHMIHEHFLEEPDHCMKSYWPYVKVIFIREEEHIKPKTACGTDDDPGSLYGKQDSAYATIPITLAPPELHNEECKEGDGVKEFGEELGCCGEVVPEWRCRCDNSRYTCEQGYTPGTVCVCAESRGFDSNV